MMIIPAGSNHDRAKLRPIDGAVGPDRQLHGDTKAGEFSQKKLVISDQIELRLTGSDRYAVLCHSFFGASWL